MREHEILVFGVRDFVALVNQTLEYAYASTYIEGEISNFKISKNRWVYFDLKDNEASVRCFMTVYQLNGLFEDGMHVRVRAAAKLHHQYGFSLTIQQMQPVGTGAIKRAADMLKEKLVLEGLFAPERKRAIPFPPKHIALIASRESAAYGDFIKVLGARWGGIVIDSYDVQVQGEAAPEGILNALGVAGQSSAEVIIVTRGGGSSDDLLAFDDERVVRAIAGSRLPTVVAIGHERDESLAELAADLRASTPSNAAELLVPDRREIIAQLSERKKLLAGLLVQVVKTKRITLDIVRTQLRSSIVELLQRKRSALATHKQLHALLHPERALQRGYALIMQDDGRSVRSITQLRAGQGISVLLRDGSAQAIISSVHTKQTNQTNERET